MARRLLLLFVTSLVARQLCAQQPQLKFDHIGLEQGLSESIVLAIMQDTKGYMWFGTADGLNRFDGYEFKVFKSTSTDSTSLSANYVQSLYKDRHGNLWVGTLGGLDLYDAEHERFIHYKYDANAPRGKNEFNVNTMCEGRNGVLWVGRIGAGLTKLVLDYSSFPPKVKESRQYVEHKGSSLGLNDNDVASIVEDSSGAIWVATWEGGLSRLDASTNRFTHFVHSSTNPHSLCKNFLRMLALDSRGYLWIASEGNGLDRLNLRGVDLKHPEKTRFKHYPYMSGVTKGISYNIVRSLLLEDREGRFWVGTDGGGVNLYLPETDSFVAYKHDKYDPASLANDRVVSMYEDNAGTLWFGTWGSGVSVYSAAKEKFKNSPEIDYINEHLTSKFVLSIYQDRKRNLWIGTHTVGLNKYNPVTKQVQHFKHDPNNSNSLSNDVVWSISEDPQGFIWLATDQGVNKFDPATSKFTHYNHRTNDANSISSNFASRVYADAEQNVWVATNAGLCKIDAHTDRVTRYEHYSTTKDNTSSGAIAAIYEDAEGQLWLGLGGFLRFNKKTEEFLQFQSEANIPNRENLNLASSIFVARNGVVWMGTYGYGLHGFNPKTRSFAHYVEKDGLPNNVVYGILEDAHGLPAGQAGNLWVSTNKGVAKFNPNTKTFTNYDAKDGLQSNEFNRGAYFQADDGMMYFGGINGFNAFHPDSIRNNQHVPPVVITAFKKYDEPVRFEKSIEAVEEIELRHDDNFFSFEFAGLDYVNPQKNQYAYMLQGVDKRWVECGTRRYARYTNIDPGEYVFHVKAANSDGVWNEQGASMRVIIIPPFWKRGWFIFVMSLTGLAALTGVVRYVATRKLRQQIEQLEREKAIQEERYRTRDRIARDLHDDLASTVGSANFFIESVKNQLKDAPKQAREFLEKTSSLLTEAEEAMSDIVWSVSPRHDTLGSLLARVRITTTDICKANQIKHEVDVSGDITEHTLPDDVRRGVYLIFKEAISNAVRHAKASIIRVTFRVERGFLVLTIQDNGKGIPSADVVVPTKRGHGLRNMKKRAEEIQAEFTIETIPGQGTKVQLSKRMTQVSH